MCVVVARECVLFAHTLAKILAWGESHVESDRLFPFGVAEGCVRGFWGCL